MTPAPSVPLVRPAEGGRRGVRRRDLQPGDRRAQRDPFETAPRTAADLRTRIQDATDRFPTIVAEDAGAVIQDGPPSVPPQHPATRVSASSRCTSIATLAHEASGARSCCPGSSRKRACAATGSRLPRLPHQLRQPRPLPVARIPRGRATRLSSLSLSLSLSPSLSLSLSLSVLFSLSLSLSFSSSLSLISFLSLSLHLIH